MIIPVKLKPFSEWPEDCSACKAAGYESFATERQMDRASGLWMEIDTSTEHRDCHTHSLTERRYWNTTRESLQCLMDAQGIWRGLTVTEEEGKQMTICEHMLELSRYTLYTGRVRAYFYRMGLMRLPKNEPPAKDPDPLVGKLFLSIRRCAGCSASEVDGKGEVMAHIPGTDAYILQPFTLGPKVIRAEHVQRVAGHEMREWRFYETVSMMLYDEQQLAGLGHEHRQESSPAVN